MGDMMDREQGAASAEPRKTQRPAAFDPRPSRLAPDPREVLTAAPVETLQRMRDEMDKWLGLAPGSRDPGRAWSPPVEVSERDGLLRIVLALPGMARDDLKVEVVNEGLLISGKPRSDGGQGAFRRCLALPPEAKTEEARARFEGGLLRITLPMAEPSSLRHEIPIEAGEPGAGERATPERDPERHMRAAV